MTLADLNDDKLVRYRTGIAGTDDVNWDSWQNGHLYLRRHKKTNKIMIVTIKEGGWAEADEADYNGNGVFVVENYYLQIEGLK